VRNSCPSSEEKSNYRACGRKNAPISWVDGKSFRQERRPVPGGNSIAGRIIKLEEGRLEKKTGLQTGSIKEKRRAARETFAALRREAEKGGHTPVGKGEDRAWGTQKKHMRQGARRKGLQAKAGSRSLKKTP